VPPHMRHTGNSGPERALGDSFEGSNEDDDDWKYCSSFEGRERQRLLDVHALEATSGTAHLPMNRRRLDPKKAVRKFVRSGSGMFQEMCYCSILLVWCVMWSGASYSSGILLSYTATPLA